MKNFIFLVFIAFVSTGVNAQTAKELVGKWQLVKLTEDGKEKDIKEKFNSDQVFQVFNADGKFQGIVGEKSTKGKWKLSKDNKELTVTVNLIPVKFSVDYFDSNKRIITQEMLGTLEYKKISD
jgi:hypothetical protein